MQNGNARPITIPMTHHWTNSHSPVCIIKNSVDLKFLYRQGNTLCKIMYLCRNICGFQQQADHQAVLEDGRVQITRSVVRYMAWTNAISGVLSANGKKHARVSAISGHVARTHMRGQCNSNKCRADDYNYPKLKWDILILRGKWELFRVEIVIKLVIRKYILWMKFLFNISRDRLNLHILDKILKETYFCSLYVARVLTA